MYEGSSLPNDSDIGFFEQSSKKNGETYWLASTVMGFLGYNDVQSFRSAIKRAQMACLNLDIPVEENFISVTNKEGKIDTKLTRFACYLVAMNADVNKPEVAKVQAYFVAMAESVRRYIEEAENVLRVQIRGEITQREKSLSGVAREANVTEFGLFQNAGYRGMYNMNLSDLKDMRGVPSHRSPLDFMGKTELAANLFRITQTEERLKNENIRGQKDSERAAEFVGKQVRETMIKTSRTHPEHIPSAPDIKHVKKEIKKTEKTFKKIDRPKK